MSTNDLDKLCKQWIFISQKTAPLRINFTSTTRIGRENLKDGALSICTSLLG